MRTEDLNEAAFRRLIEEGPNKGNLAVVDEVVASHCKSWVPVSNDPIVGPDGSRTLIAGFRSLNNDDVINRNMRTAVRELLSNTRLLLNSPPPIQGQFRGVFLDLELVLVKMTLLTPSTIIADRQAIETTVERRKLVTRMRDLIPTPSASNAN